MKLSGDCFSPSCLLLGRCSITVHRDFHSGRFQVRFVVQLCRLSFAKLVCFLVSYLVDLISRYRIDVLKSCFSISTTLRFKINRGGRLFLS